MFQRQLLDEYKERVGILIPMGGHHWGRERDDLAGPMCSALNEFMVHEWLDLEPRFFCTLQVPMEHPKLAVAEIERYRNDKRFVQILMSGHQEAEIGDQKYWPIYEAAADAGLPLGVHHGNDPRGRHGTGYPSYYTHEHIGYAYTLTALALSMITEGVFEEFPKLQVVSIEAGISWATGLQWEMDTTYEMLGREQAFAVASSPVGVLSVTTSGSPRSQSRSPTIRTTSWSPTSSPGFSTASCSLRTTHTGTSTPLTGRFRPHLPRNSAEQILGGRERLSLATASIR